MVYLNILYTGWNRPYFDEIIKALKHLDKKAIEITVRPHPKEGTKNNKYYKQQLTKYGIEGEIDNKTNLYEQIKQCDIHLTVGSTVTLEALIMGKPTIVARYIDWGEADFFHNAEVLTAYNQKQLIQMLKNPTKEYLKFWRNKNASKQKPVFGTPKDFDANRKQ